MAFSRNYFISSVLESSCTRMYTADLRTVLIRYAHPSGCYGSCICSKIPVFRIALE